MFHTERYTDTKYNRNENTADSLGLLVIILIFQQLHNSRHHCVQHTILGFILIASKHFYSLAIISGINITTFSL